MATASQQQDPTQTASAASGSNEFNRYQDATTSGNNSQQQTFINSRYQNQQQFNANQQFEQPPNYSGQRPIRGRGGYRQQPQQRFPDAANASEQ